MAQILRRVAVSGLGLALATIFAFAGTAHAQGEVTVGGVVEMIGGASDNGSDGFSRGLFSRISVGYANTLDNGLEISATISYLLNQRGNGGTIKAGDIGLVTDGDNVMVGNDALLSAPIAKGENAGMMNVKSGASPDASTNYAPDVLSISVGGGFGTVSIGQHAAASCAMLPRPIAFVPGGVNATWYSLFTGFDYMNVVFAEANYCGTSTALSYATPSIGGLSAMITYAPNMAANQGTAISNATASATNKPDYVAIAGAFSSDMGAANVSIGASYQMSSADAQGGEIDSASVAATVGMGGATLGFAWFSNGGNVADTNEMPHMATYTDSGDIEGYTFGAKYALGAITPGITYSYQENSMSGEEETALAVGANYSIGGGLSVFAEYMSLEEDGAAASTDDTLLMGGASLAF